jgi:UDP-N-acetylmuramoyl-L-alanyl-D-glutamate--2,6-diaminopimelate ligase
MEVSSHALSQKRVEDCVFKAGVFTNLTHEHLDYHHTMEEYFDAKAILFKRLLKNSGGVPVINVDDAWGSRLAGGLNEAITFSLCSDKAASIAPKRATLGDSGIQAVCDTPAGAIAIRSSLVGEYNLQNILGAIGASIAVGIKPERIEAGIANLKRVPGRLEKSAGQMGIAAYVDYAHTGDALKRALEALRQVAKGRIITVFGCGGNRDRGKRPEMGAVSAALSDITIITSDNPRDEDPLEIIKEVEAGAIKAGARRCNGSETPETKAYVVMPDRREAIQKAVSLAREGDTVLVAGKGHEVCQIALGVSSHFNDLEELDGAISRKGRDREP